jgi:hypothetical protein
MTGCSLPAPIPPAFVTVRRPAMGKFDAVQEDSVQTKRSLDDPRVYAIVLLARGKRCAGALWRARARAAALE